MASLLATSCTAATAAVREIGSRIMDAVIALALEADSEDDRKKVETTIGVVGASLNDLMVWLPRALFPCVLVLICL